MSDENKRLQSLLEDGRPLERISALEASQNRLSHDVTNLSRTIETQGAETRKAFQQISSTISTNQKTQWPVVLASLSFVVLIIGGILNGYIRDLNRIEKSVHDITDRVIDHNIQVMHPATKMYIDRLQQQIDKIDE